MMLLIFTLFSIYISFIKEQERDFSFHLHDGNGVNRGQCL